QVIAKVAAECGEDRLAISFRRRNVTQVLRWKATTHIDHVQMNTLLGKRRKYAFGIAKRRIPSIHIHHLRPDMERHTVGDQPQLVSVNQDINCHLRNTSEFPRERPFSSLSARQDTTKH